MPRSLHCRRTMLVDPWATFVVGVLLLIPGLGHSRASEPQGSEPPGKPTSEPEAPKPKVPNANDSSISAAALVQGVYDSFNWIQEVESFYIRADYKIVNTAEQLRWQAQERERPTLGPRSKVIPVNDPMNTKWITEWAWDRTRIRRSNEYHDGKTIASTGMAVWNGKLAVWSHQDKDGTWYTFGNKHDGVFSERLVNNYESIWGPPRPYRFWWLPVDIEEYQKKWSLSPGDFTLAGQEEFNGRRCHVVESPVGRTRLHIGVDDGRLYGQALLLFAGSKDDCLSLCRKISGREIKTLREWRRYTKMLEPAKAVQTRRHLVAAEYAFARPIRELWFDDYREVAPRSWMPYRQTLNVYNLQLPPPHLDSTRYKTITKVSINQPLADDLFEIEPVEGAFVQSDSRYEPSIAYKYRKDQTEAERLALCAKERKLRAEAAEEEKRLNAVIESRMGQVPLPFPETGWHNSKPLTWEELRGKVVVLHFWDVHCAPCEGELATLAGWTVDSNSDRIVIGIHRHTEEMDAALKKLAKFNVKYPVMFDAPAAEPEGNGPLHDWFGNVWWPHTVLIDKQGRVAGHGQLWMGGIYEKLGKLRDEAQPTAKSE